MGLKKIAGTRERIGNKALFKRNPRKRKEPEEPEARPIERKQGGKVGSGQTAYRRMKGKTRRKDTKIFEFWEGKRVL